MKLKKHFLCFCDLNNFSKHAFSFLLTSHRQTMSRENKFNGSTQKFHNDSWWFFHCAMSYDIWAYFFHNFVFFYDDFPTSVFHNSHREFFFRFKLPFTLMTKRKYKVFLSTLKWRVFKSFFWTWLGGKVETTWTTTKEETTKINRRKISKENNRKSWTTWQLRG